MKCYRRLIQTLIGVLGFWGKTKGRKWAISALRNNAGVSITSAEGKLRIGLEALSGSIGSKSVDDAFDEDWKQEVESTVRVLLYISTVCEDNII